MKRGQEMLDYLIDECIAELERKKILPTHASSASSSSSSSAEEEQRPRTNGMVRLVTLDSSAAYKLSRHYVFRIRNTAWASNAACGSFMQEFYERILAQETRAARTILGAQTDKDEEKPSELESRRIIGRVLSNAEHLAALERALCRPSFFVFTPSSREAACFVVDMQVYSKNRTFRMYQSSKPGSNRRFLQTVEEKRAQSFHPDETVFYQSLVTFFYNNGHRVTRVIEPCDFEHSKKRKLRDSAGILPKKRICAPSSSMKGHDPIGLAEYFELECGYALHYESISFSAQYGTVLYPTKTRYCSILEKRTCGEYNEHTNNNVYMIVDPMRRTVRLQCHNQECKLYANESKNYSAFTKRLPEHLHSKLDAFVESHLRVSATEAKRMDALYNFML